MDTKNGKRENILLEIHENVPFNIPFEQTSTTNQSGWNPKRENI